MGKRVSRAEMRRQRELLLLSRSEREPLPRDLQQAADRFKPTSLDDVVWSAVRPLFLAIMTTCSLRSREQFRKRCCALAGLLGWAAAEGLDMSIPALMRYEMIDRYVQSLTKRTASSRRSHLRALARDSNPAAIPPAPLKYEHVAIRPPYTEAEMAAICRVALNQPTFTQRRTLCAVVGLARGAGLDSQDFRHLARPHVEDSGADGIWVDVQGGRPRPVPVRRAWEKLVRVGLEGLKEDDLVIGTSTGRRNVAAKIIEQATILGDAPRIETNRLRTTWLADLLASDVPLTVVMAVSGLTSARTITEVLQFLDTEADSGAAR